MQFAPGVVWAVKVALAPARTGELTDIICKSSRVVVDSTGTTGNEEGVEGGEVTAGGDLGIVVVDVGGE